MGKSRAGQSVGKQNKIKNETRRYLLKALDVDDQEAESMFQIAHDLLESYHIRDKSIINEVRKQREYKK